MTRIFFLVLLTLTCSAFTFAFAQETGTRQKLIGSWIYSGLEFNDSMTESEKVESEKADKMNKDLIITFESNGNYIVWNKQAGKKNPFAKGAINLTNKGRHLKIEGLEGDIDKLNEELLTLSHLNRPVMVFKKYAPENK